MTTFISRFRSWRLVTRNGCGSAAFYLVPLGGAGTWLIAAALSNARNFLSKIVKLLNLLPKDDDGTLVSFMRAGMNTYAMDDLRKSSISGRPDDERREHLEYLADLLGELQRMAEREGCRKLSRMLAISYAEAQRESDRKGS